MNSIHRMGLDLNGERGTDLFSLDAVSVQKAAANIGASSLRVEGFNDSLVGSKLQMIFNAERGSWSVSSSNGESIPNFVSRLELGELSILVEGQPKNGDKFFIEVTDTSGADMAVLISDASKLAAKNSIRVRAPNDPSQKVGFVSMLENLDVKKASPPAKIIINSRTGTIVISGDVKVMPAAVAHGSLKVTVNENVNVDQADALAVGAGANANAGPAVQNPDTEIEVEEDVAKAFLFGQGVSLSDIVDSINAVGATSSDLVAILEALREAGALNAELIVI